MPNKIDHQWVDAYFEFGIDIFNRRVFLHADLDSESVGAAVKGLYLMETNSDEKIEIFISSLGGDIYEALALYDIMNTIKCPIHTFAYGKCMSAAPLLLAAGLPGERWVSPNVAFMYHDWSTHLSGTGTHIKEDVKHTDELDEKWTRALVEHTNQTYKFWRGKSSRPHDFYFWADEAIEWGLADHIWVER